MSPKCRLDVASHLYIRGITLARMIDSCAQEALIGLVYAQGCTRARRETWRQVCRDSTRIRDSCLQWFDWHENCRGWRGRPWWSITWSYCRANLDHANVDRDTLRRDDVRQDEPEPLSDKHCVEHLFVRTRDCGTAVMRHHSATQNATSQSGNTERQAVQGESTSHFYILIK